MGLAISGIGPILAAGPIVAALVDIDKRVEEWCASGWNGFDAKAAPYSFDDIERDRSRYARPAMMGAASNGAWATLDDDFRRNYDENFADEGAPFDEYAPAYRYGADGVRNGRYANKGWDDVEAQLRSDGERDFPNRDWTKVHEAARYGFMRAR